MKSQGVNEVVLSSPALSNGITWLCIDKRGGARTKLPSKSNHSSFACVGNL